MTVVLINHRLKPLIKDKILIQIKRLIGWFDASVALEENAHVQTNKDKISWTRITPFIAMHLAVFAVFFVGFSWFAFWACIALYFIRMFAITAFYHRYFSHKNFKTSRIVQFVFAFIGASSAQRGPLWWASHHRVHHATSDTQSDPHSPKHKGFLWSHTLWFLSDKNFSTQADKIKDFAKYPELKWLDRFDLVAPTILALTLFALGGFLETHYPQLQTNAWQLLIWGFFVSTVILYHATYTINSLAHRFGKRRFNTQDNSRNNFWLALLTLGEGWHNNHHYYAGTVRQGFKWYEIDVSFYILKMMSWLGLVWELKPIPPKVVAAMNNTNKVMK